MNKKTIITSILLSALSVASFTITTNETFNRVKAEDSDLRTITLCAGVLKVDMTPGIHYCSNNKGVSNIEYDMDKSEYCSVSSSINGFGVANDGEGLASFSLAVYVYGAISVNVEFEKENEGRLTINAFDVNGKYMGARENEKVLLIDDFDTEYVSFTISAAPFSAVSVYSIVITYSESACQRIMSEKQE